MPETLHIRPEMPSDIADIAEVTRCAFDRTKGEEVQMVSDRRASQDFIPRLSLMAVLEGRVVGHVITAPADLQGDSGHIGRPRRVLLLGLISVLPEFQRRGIGTALMWRTLEAAATRPEPMIVLFGHSAYYPRFGFRPASDFGLKPDLDAAMIYPLRANLSEYAGLSLPD